MFEEFIKTDKIIAKGIIINLKENSIDCSKKLMLNILATIKTIKTNVIQKNIRVDK